MLTIGQLADYVGVTQRAIRHYHRLGLLPEPGRDHSGYRRYDGQAVVDLTRIRTLAEAGVPLSRVKELQDAPPAETRTALDEIDHELGRRIRDLQGNRRRLRRLASGDPLDPAVQAYLDKVRTLGVSERMVRLERDGWVLMQVLYSSCPTGCGSAWTSWTTRSSATSTSSPTRCTTGRPTTRGSARWPCATSTTCSGRAGWRPTRWRSSTARRPMRWCGASTRTVARLGGPGGGDRGGAGPPRPRLTYLR